MKKAAILLALVAFTGVASAQAQLDRGPGMVGPGSPIYGLEVAWDNAAMSVGLKKAGNVAQERAAEARRAQQRNNTEGMQRAVRNMNRVAERASSNDTQGLQKAQAVLQEVMQNAPQEAQQGLQTALDNIQQAQQRIPEGAGPGGAGPGGQSGAGGQANASAQVSDARDLMEQGRQDLRQGNTAMDNGDFQAARNEFGQASQRFTEAINLVEGLDTPEAADLEQRLRDAKQSAEDARSSVDQQLDQQQGGQTGGAQGGGQP